MYKNGHYYSPYPDLESIESNYDEDFFEVDTNASARSRTRKRTFLYVLESIKTARFKWLNVAGRIVTTNGTHTLRLTDIDAVRNRYEALEQCLAVAP